MKLSVAANFTISDETNPTDVRFSSGAKTFTDVTTWAECESSTYALAVGDTDLDLPVGTMEDISCIYLFTKTAGVKIKILTGAVGEVPVSMELIPGIPAIIPVKAKSVQVSNSGGSATSIVYAAIGN